MRTLSGGQVRRLDVALAIVGNPEVVFLDEPTTGFDPGARRAAWTMLRGLADGGAAVLLTTHYMDEAQAVADRVAVMRAGELVAMGAPSTLETNEATSVEIRFELPGRHRAGRARRSSPAGSRGATATASRSRSPSPWRRCTR